MTSSACEHEPSRGPSTRRTMSASPGRSSVRAVVTIRTGAERWRIYILRSVPRFRDLVGMAVLFATAACRGPSPGDTPIRANDPDGLYAPEIVRAIDLLGHDDARCARGWISRAIDTAQGRPVKPPPRAQTLTEAARQAEREHWCLLEPAPDIARQLQGCIDAAQSPTEEHACHCQLVRPHLAFLQAAAGRDDPLPALDRSFLESCIADQAFTARCQLAAGTLRLATLCSSDAS